MPFTLTARAFEDGGLIPDRHARRGENLSPFLEWNDPPPGTNSFVLVMEDVDAPSQASRHWIVYDIPGNRRHLAEGRSSKAATEDLPHGYNDFGNLHYDGPDRHGDGKRHTYRFRLAALGVERLGIEPQSDALTIWEAASENMLGETNLIGTYG